MIAYYIVRGHTAEELVNLDKVEKLFYIAAMNNEIERENKKYRS